MKYISSYIVTAILTICFSQLIMPQPGWEIITSPTTELLRNLSVVDENYVWAAGTNGAIVKTTDGGDSWTVLNSGVTTAIYDIFFLNRNLGWAVTFPFNQPYYTRILITTDGGNNWEIIQYPEEFVQFRTIHFLDSLNGFIGGARIEKTTDGGYTWNPVLIDSSEVSDYPVIRIKFYDEMLGYASGGQRDQAGVMWRTSNGGLNWSASGISPDEIFDFYILDSLKVVGLSGDPEWIYPVEIFSTTNSGLNWTSVITQHYALSFALDFRTPIEGWSASGYFFLVTYDAGQSWDTVHTPGQTAILDLQFANDTLGFACGEDGAILRYLKMSPIIIPYDTTFTQLFQNYPNPFNEKTAIDFFLLNDSYVKINVFNVTGEKVKSLKNELMTKGHHTIEFSENTLANGVYFYTLMAEGVFETKKMMLIR